MNEGFIDCDGRLTLHGLVITVSNPSTWRATELLHVADCQINVNAPLRIEAPALGLRLDRNHWMVKGEFSVMLDLTGSGESAAVTVVVSGAPANENMCIGEDNHWQYKGMQGNVVSMKTGTARPF